MAERKHIVPHEGGIACSNAVPAWTVVQRGNPPDCCCCQRGMQQGANSREQTAMTGTLRRQLCTQAPVVHDTSATLSVHPANSYAPTFCTEGPVKVESRLTVHHTLLEPFRGSPKASFICTAPNTQPHEQEGSISRHDRSHAHTRTPGSKNLRPLLYVVVGCSASAAGTPCSAGSP